MVQFISILYGVCFFKTISINKSAIGQIHYINLLFDIKENFNMDYLTKLFQTTIYANWTIAIGTILLALIAFVTLYYYIVGDTKTRLKKKDMSYNFDKVAYEFLKTSLGSGSAKFHSPTSEYKNITVEEFIDEFNNKLLSKKTYLTFATNRNAKRYILLAKKHRFVSKFKLFHNCWA